MTVARGLRLGLTGGIACGKSTVAAGLSQQGAQVVDSDEIAREVVRPGEKGYEKVIDAFGKDILNRDRTIHRGRLGQIVFSDAIKRDLLNSLLHPIIRERWQARQQELYEVFPGVPVVVVIPLLFETGLESEFDSIACVSCSRWVQEQRLKARGLDFQQLEQRISAQMPVGMKMERAEVVLWNDGSLLLLEAQARRLFSLWS
jgi:dephospho-CoA kinase